MNTEYPPIKEGSIIDSHVHIAGGDTEKTGCYLSKQMRHSVAFKLNLFLNGISEKQFNMEGSTLFIKRICSNLEKSVWVKKNIILSFDGVHHPNGYFDEERTHFFVPDRYVLDLASQHSNIWAGISIHPYSKNCIQRLEQGKEQGAKLIKWIPGAQCIDPMDRQLDSFYKRVAKLNIPMLVHTGYEHTIPVYTQKFANPIFLRRMLDHGVYVIAAHGGTRHYPWEPCFFSEFVQLLDSYPNLFGDTAALFMPFARYVLYQLIKSPRLAHRFFFGTDFPVPLFSTGLWSHISKKAKPLFSKNQTVLDRAFLLMWALGLDVHFFERATSFFIDPQSSTSEI
jgi:uncharacterized protein